MCKGIYYHQLEDNMTQSSYNSCIYHEMAVSMLAGVLWCVVMYVYMLVCCLSALNAMEWTWGMLWTVSDKRVLADITLQLMRSFAVFNFFYVFWFWIEARQLSVFNNPEAEVQTVNSSKQVSEPGWCREKRSSNSNDRKDTTETTWS